MAQETRGAGFTATNTFDCPFCHRKQVTYRVASIQPFDMPEGAAFAYIVRCNQCYKRSVHLSRKNIERHTVQGYPETYYQFDEAVSDDDFFLSVPSSPSAPPAAH